MKSTLKNKDKKSINTHIEDEEVQKMLEEWDIVRCRICQKKISMLNSRQLRDGSGYICKEGH